MDRPCATIEAACAKVPKDLDRDYVVHVGGGTYSAGCHLVGMRQVGGADGGSPGSVTVDCAQNLYAPADGGSATNLLGFVTAGSNATRDVWYWDGGTFNNDELKGYQIQVTGGTGAAPEKWAITTNTTNALTIGGVSGAIGPATAPAIGSTAKLWTRAVNINGNLTNTVAPVGFPPVTNVAAAFVVNAIKGVGSDATSPVVTIKGCKFGTGASRGVMFSGPVAFVENECATTTSSCFRAMDGVSSLAGLRNIATGSSTFIVAGNGALGSFLTSVQLYNNFSNGTVGNLFSGGQVGLFLSGMNEFTTSAEGIRANSIQDGQSRYDKITAAAACVRSPLTIDATDIGAGIKMNFTGLSCTSSGVYSVMLAGRGNRVNMDSTSTVTSANHHAALANDGQLWWASGATWNGAGSDDFAFTDTGGSLTEAAATAGATAKYQCNDHGSCAGIPTHAGGIYAPVVAPIGSNSGADGQLQMCSGTATATNGALSVTFNSVARCSNFSSAPACGCSFGSDGGTNAIPCLPTAAATSSCSFLGDKNMASAIYYWWAFGPK